MSSTTVCVTSTYQSKHQLTQLRPVRGVVVDVNGKPVANATEVAAIDGPENDSSTRKTGPDGRFIFDKPGLPASTLLFARASNLFTNGGIESASSGNTVLKVSSGQSASFNGIVKDADGHLVANAPIMLFRSAPGQNSGSEVATTSTDSQGHYLFGPTYAGFVYQASVNGPGFKGGYTKQVTGKPGKLVTFANITVTRADSFLGGTIVDPNGNPIAGATITVCDVFPNPQATTGPQGRFHLAGVPRKNTVIGVQAPEGRTASIQVPTGTDDAIIKVENSAEHAVDFENVMAAVKSDPTNHGDGTDANKLLASAEKRASVARKRVLLVFHASWCGPCLRLNKYLNDRPVKPIIDAHFIVQEIDTTESKTKCWETPGGDALCKRYGGNGGIPYFVLLDESGKRIGSSIFNGQNMGMPSEPDEIKFFLNTLKSAAPSITPSEMAILKAGFSK